MSQSRPISLSSDDIPNYAPAADLPQELMPSGAQIMAPPPPTTRPQSSHSTSSGKRRKRERDNDTDSIAPSNASSDFSSPAKKRIRSFYQGCFHCGTPMADICHVMPKGHVHLHNQYNTWGFFDFNLGSDDNAVPLCPNCHRAFDDALNPGLFFVPADLDYFKDFERQDFKRRRDALRQPSTTKPVAPKRQCPTASSYLDHCQRQHELSADAFGGTYYQYTLRNIFPTSGFTPNFDIPGRGPKQDSVSWHGAPMAALFHAFQALGRIRSGLPDELKKDLRELQDLYDRDPEKEVEGASSEGEGQHIPAEDTPTRAPDAMTQTHTGERNPSEAVQHPSHTTSAQNYNNESTLLNPSQATQGSSHTPQQKDESTAHDTPARQNTTPDHEPTAAATHDSAIDVSSDYKAKEKCIAEAHTAPAKESTTAQGDPARWTWGPGSSSSHKAFYMSKLLAL